VPTPDDSTHWNHARGRWRVACTVSQQMRGYQVPLLFSRGRWGIVARPPTMRKIATLLTWALVAVLWSSPVLAAAPAAVRVDANADLGLAAAAHVEFNEAVAEAARAGAADAGVEHDNHASVVATVEVTWADADQTSYSGGIQIRDGGVELAAETFDCARCGTVTLLDSVRGEVTLALEHVVWPEEPLETPQQSTTAESTADESRPVATRSQQRQLGQLGWTGVGVAGTGMVSVAVGATLWAHGDQSETTENGARLQVVVTPYRRIGIALVAVGAGVAVLGGALFSVDFARRRRARLAASPLLGPNLSGIAVSGRF